MKENWDKETGVNSHPTRINIESSPVRTFIESLGFKWWWFFLNWLKIKEVMIFLNQCVLLLFTSSYGTFFVNDSVMNFSVMLYSFSRRVIAVNSSGYILFKNVSTFYLKMCFLLIHKIQLTVCIHAVHCLWS